MENIPQIENYYQILNISLDSDDKTIKKNYRKLALKWHPDKNPGVPEAEEKFKSISNAYHTLIDPEKRKYYDSILKKNRMNDLKIDIVDPYSVFENSFKDITLEELINDELLSSILESNSREYIIPKCLYKSTDSVRIACVSKYQYVYLGIGLIINYIGFDSIIKSIKNKKINDISGISSMFLVGGFFTFVMTRTPILHIDRLTGRFYSGGIPIWKSDRKPFYQTELGKNCTIFQREQEEHSSKMLEEQLKIGKPLPLVAFTSNINYQELTVGKTVLSLLNWIDAINLSERLNHRKINRTVSVIASLLILMNLENSLKITDNLIKICTSKFKNINSKWTQNVIIFFGLLITKTKDPILEMLGKLTAKYIFEEEVIVRPPKYGPYLPPNWTLQSILKASGREYQHEGHIYLK